MRFLFVALFLHIHTIHFLVLATTLTATATVFVHTVALATVVTATATVVTTHHIAVTHWVVHIVVVLHS